MPDLSDQAQRSGPACGQLDAVWADQRRSVAEEFSRGPTSVLDFQPDAEHCLVFADPAGHPLCLTTVDELG